MSMSSEVADQLYEMAGTLVPEDRGDITVEKYNYLLRDSVHLIIQEVLSEHPLPYKLQDFQLLTLHCLGSLQNVVLVAPTGSGKMLCSYYGVLVLQKVLNIPNGVGLLTQPLSALMEEKLENPPVITGVISMNGDIKLSNCNKEVEPLRQCKTGDVGLLIGHPESWLTELAEEIIESLKGQGLVVGTFLDEFQMNLSDHWGSNFRPHMKTVPGQLRGKGVRSSPCLAMSATATDSDIEAIKNDLGFRSINTVVLRADPIQSQFNYIRVQRPPNIYGSFGSDNAAGEMQPGLIDTVNKLYLNKYVENIKNRENVKKAIMLFRNEDDIADIFDDLCERLPEQAADPSTCPFVMNHSNIGPITAENYRQRKGDISLYLSTSVMLLGLDLNNIDIVIMVRPMNMLHYVVQAAGRGGRNMGNGLRRRVLFYLLWNKNDIGSNVPGMSTDMKEFCETQECLKKVLKIYFGFMNSDSLDPGWCCSNCIGVV